jgi:hypothetical protein
MTRALRPRQPFSFLHNSAFTTIKWFVDGVDPINGLSNLQIELFPYGAVDLAVEFVNVREGLQNLLLQAAAPPSCSPYYKTLYI